MKAKIRIPTDQYAFIEVDVDEEPRDIIRLHNDLIEIYKLSSFGDINDKDFQKIADKYLWEDKLGTDDYLEKCTPNQQMLLNWLKRSKKRRNK